MFRLWGLPVGIGRKVATHRKPTAYIYCTQINQPLNRSVHHPYIHATHTDLVDEELDVVRGNLLAGEVHEVVHVDVHQLRDDVHLVEGRLLGLVWWCVWGSGDGLVWRSINIIYMADRARQCPKI